MPKRSLSKYRERLKILDETITRLNKEWQDEDRDEAAYEPKAVQAGGLPTLRFVPMVASDALAPVGILVDGAPVEVVVRQHTYHTQHAFLEAHDPLPLEVVAPFEVVAAERGWFVRLVGHREDQWTAEVHAEHGRVQIHDKQPREALEQAFRAADAGMWTVPYDD